METKENIIVNIKDYSMSPGPRYVNQGCASGEDFYHKVLNKNFAEAYQKGLKLIVVLDGVDGYASSFLDEAFGNLVYDFGVNAVEGILIIESKEEPEWITMIETSTFNEWEKRRENNDSPKYSVEHEERYVLEGDSIVLKN